MLLENAEEFIHNLRALVVAAFRCVMLDAEDARLFQPVVFLRVLFITIWMKSDLKYTPRAIPADKEVDLSMIPPILTRVSTNCDRKREEKDLALL